MKTYLLINPHIEGSLDTSFKTKSVDDAANMTYNTLSKYFSNNIPQFCFSLQKKDNSEKIYHFQVTEKITDGDKIKYEIRQLVDNEFNNNNLTNFLASIEEQEGGRHRLSEEPTLHGGKHHHSKKSKNKYKVYDDEDSSSSSSSDDDDYYYYYKPVNRTVPINYWSYSPYVYNMKRFYVPTFIPSVTPYIYITYNSSSL